MTYKIVVIHFILIDHFGYYDIKYCFFILRPVYSKTKFIEISIDVEITQP